MPTWSYQNKNLLFFEVAQPNQQNREEHKPSSTVVRAEKLVKTPGTPHLLPVDATEARQENM
jgi:hypothetical protein